MEKLYHRKNRQQQQAAKTAIKDETRNSLYEIMKYFYLFSFAVCFSDHKILLSLPRAAL